MKPNRDIQTFERDTLRLAFPHALVLGKRSPDADPSLANPLCSAAKTSGILFNRHCAGKKYKENNGRPTRVSIQSP